MIPNTGPIAAAFLSHAVEDREIARTIKHGLENIGISVFDFESDLGFGRPIWDSVRRKIETSDYLLVLLSRAALLSDAVAREIGLAFELLRKSGPSPIIVGVTARELPSMTILPQRFDDGTPFAAPIDFAALRCFSEWRDANALADFGRSLLPYVTFVTSTSDPSSLELFLRSKPCLLQLFPELTHSDYVDRIWAWQQETEAPGSKWKDVYGVLELDQQPIGVLYASVPVQGHFAFGNYFGVIGGSRHHDRAHRLVETSKQRIREINANIRGIVFEAQVPDLAFLEALSARSEREHLALMADQQALKQSLRALARLMIYQSRRTLTLVDDEGLPLPIPTPSQRASFLDDSLGSHLLMYSAWSGDGGVSDADLGPLLHFVYDQLYADAYGDESELGFRGYRQYVANLRKGYVEQHRGRARIGKVAIPRNVKLLLIQADLQGLPIDL